MKIDRNRPLIIIGGGITGLGMTLAAARAGLRVSLLESGKCAQGVSASSLRIVHGGFRYLQTLDFGRVIASLRAQRALAEQFPAQFRKLTCLMPIEPSGFRSRLPVSAALRLYGIFYRAVARARYPGKVLSAKAAEDLALVRGLFPRGALMWEDLLIDDPDALARAVRLAAEREGAVVLEDHPVRQIARESGILKVYAHTPTGDQAWEAGAIINATGSRSVAIPRRGEFAPVPFDQTRWCCAYNVIINRPLSPRAAVGVRSPQNRLYFAVPRGEGTAIGTGQIFVSKGAPNTPPAPSEIEAFLADFNLAWPGAEVKPDEVRHVEWGLLPAVESGRDLLVSLPRVHADGNYIEFLSTKYTTFLSQAERLVGKLRW